MHIPETLWKDNRPTRGRPVRRVQPRAAVRPSTVARVISLMSSLSKMRTAPPAQALQHMARHRWKSAGSRTKGQGRGKKGKGKEKPKSEKFDGWFDNCGTWGHKDANCRCSHGGANRGRSRSTLSGGNPGSRDHEDGSLCAAD